MFYFFIFCISSALRFVQKNAGSKHFEVNGSFPIEYHELCVRCLWLITCANVLDMGNLFLQCSFSAENGECSVAFLHHSLPDSQQVLPRPVLMRKLTSFDDLFQPVQRPNIMFALLMLTHDGFECYWTYAKDRMTLVMTVLGICL